LKVIKKFPYVTVTLVAASYAFYFLAGRYLSTWEWFSETQARLMVRFVFHPILHTSWDHLRGNTFFLVAGGLVESWMFFTRKIRWCILFLCYLVSLDVTYLGWVALTPSHVPPVGLSSMISSALAFLLVYCWMFRRRIRFRGWNLLALAGTLLLLVTLVWNTLNIVTGVFAGLYDPEYLYPILYHLFAFGQGMVVGVLLFHKVREDTDQQKSTERT
jgi:membrane associated rhomboid family serine protease